MWAAEIGVAALVYFVAACVMTWPAVLHTDEVIIGGGELGGWLWRYWWHFMEVEALGQAQHRVAREQRVAAVLGRACAAQALVALHACERRPRGPE